MALQEFLLLSFSLDFGSLKTMVLKVWPNFWPGIQPKVIGKMPNLWSNIFLPPNVHNKRWFVNAWMHSHLSCPKIVEPQLQIQLPGMESQSSRKQQNSQHGIVASSVQKATTEWWCKNRETKRILFLMLPIHSKNLTNLEIVYKCCNG